MKDVFITGATGYIGTRLVKQLLQGGYRVTALVRKGSEGKLPLSVKKVIADPFDAASFQSSIPQQAVFVQLLGVAHPSPRKEKQFRDIDLVSVKASANGAAAAGAAQFIYLSVAMEGSDIMRAFREVRQEGEAYCREKGLNCTFIRPWYVVGPGHYWPVLLLPLYGIAEILPGWRKKARGMALITIRQLLHTLVRAIGDEPVPLRIKTIRNIRNGN